MDLLFSNDRKGAYPQSWYAATAHEAPEHPGLQGEVKADVCVVGAGFTGLSTALHLAQRGVDVVLLDAHRVGFGASGRNGGQLGSGQRQDQKALIQMMGRDDARHLWLLAEEAKQLVRGLIDTHGIDCDYRPGVAWTAFSEAETREMHGYADLLEREYGYTQIERLDGDACHALCPSPAYKGGILDMGAGHLHPLNFALGLARAAKAAGVRIHERTHVHSVEDGRPATVRCDHGLVRAETVVLAGNGYLGGLNRKVAARVMPINNFVVATEPLGDRAAEVLTRDVAVADSKFVVNYFRLSHDKRLLFGGGESYGYRFPDDIAAKVRKPLQEIFPHLTDVRIDHAWGGTLAITMKRLPYLSRVGDSILSSSGYSGHGVGTATHAGLLMAKAILGQGAGFDMMARLPAPRFPGGPAFRSPLLALAMTWFALRDRLGV
ncbi:FAD-binding oxidoreductase [Lutimaribacter sp. EGI FJ00015]|uniref:FAD-binding oxidoreductase n=1 Tax=Lutimaribacter degradans TaxID=2945989 RepID=A0ACC5ZT27_9RHOB|nr:FAD-binding oxidoreductase [Lutimaribacter sp. EGI FJ00013]MCM2561437.1 FAD-binding oxidoreductase [Lutimaribacter sp. EGI FJ00013]MCO0612853.1 FAD-binding oxidoreductase [Lutimaribacter sp. EGI FJ00015]MCO0635511.1 FAD-binding oxidoreductase [Lutimaribacter sp. EGI FJ00014]